ncbi:GGDEF domain-containing protein [Cupriavidus pinatubonensis]|uniref:GGDEF domain-containing protein n=1 Tax=Cupriavidus pinatubonensis TaxID=248026 RepID=UPI001126B8F4|nr:GGDEF domain-containing protein [Cupriavidus pinatubonensis]QYY28674.1 GGDEF domain-containing protein [Cupriavidus pinatubonensis]TPQ38798.1 GGDEF domain-containing protein [Cupriavidus pinatubonensis]
MSVPTALLVITAALSAMMLAIVWSLRRCGLPGVPDWCNANLLVTISLVLFTLRGYVNDIFSLVMANAALAGALALFYAGCVRFCGGQPRWGRLAAGLLATMAVVVAWRYVFDVFTTRVVAVSAFHAVLCALTGITLIRWRPRSRFGHYHLTTAGFALFFALGHTARGLLSAFSLMGDPYSLQSLGLNTFFLTLGALVMPALTMGAVLMIHDTMVRRLEAIANTDGLTGVMSRKAWEDMASRALAAGARGGVPPALLIIDIDRFKGVNDTYGHAAGDAVLKGFAILAGAQVRSTDSLGRLGGEEFAVVLPATRVADAVVISERIRAGAEQHAVRIGEHGTIVRYTISGGVACLRPGETLAQLSARADAALYRAKLEGRNRIVVHEDRQTTATAPAREALPA